MSTIKYYQEDFYCKQIHAKVTDLRQTEAGTAVILDRTILFPTGGGQSCDLGTLTVENHEPLQVTDVYDSKEDDEVCHLVAGDCPLSIGDTVTIDIDWERRFDNAQRHSGEHILSGAIYKVCKGANKSFHMGENYIAIDIDLNGEKMTEQQIKDSETLANWAIWQDFEGYVVWCDGQEEASKTPTRKAVTQEGQISMVFFGPEEDPFDCCACCGTHVPHTGEIGLIKIYKVEWNKGMNRIYFDCGGRALAQMQEDMDILHQIEERFSANNSDIIQKLDSRDNKESELRQTLATLSQYYRDNEMARIVSEIQADESGFYQDTFSMVGADDLVKLGFRVIEQIERDILVALIHEPSNTVLLFSKGDAKCGNLVKDIAKPLGGKGGGRPDQARAMFGDAETLAKFMEELSTRF